MRGAQTVISNKNTTRVEWGGGGERDWGGGELKRECGGGGGGGTHRNLFQ